MARVLQKTEVTKTTVSCKSYKLRGGSVSAGFSLGTARANFRD